ncbi:MAG: ECF transporter S component, partial [Anaeroplasmataceae bacterium]|nr:ECF transporter S component [Anaeroplasmataceae bacterium]
MKKNFFTIKRMCFVAIFAALSILFYTVIPKIKLPIFPSFLELNFSMIPIVICSFMLGPIDGAVCVFLRFLVKLPLTNTACVGEVADLLIGLPVAVSAGIFYHHTHFKLKEVWAFLSAFLLWVLMGIFTNAVINIPFYKATIPGGMNTIIGASNDAFQLISGGRIETITEGNFMFYYIFYAVIPFNSILAAIVLLITWPV